MSRRALRALALLVLGGIAGVGCGSSNFTYVKSSETDVFFRVPSDWRVFDEEEVLANKDGLLSPQAADAQRRVQWVVAFDASPKPTMGNVENYGRAHPAGIARVRALQDDERESYGLKAMRSEFFDGDPLEAAEAENSNVEVLVDDEVTRPGGLHGTQLVLNVRQDGTYLTINKLTLVDPTSRLVYLLLIGCEAKCYLQHKSEIDDVVESWTHREQT